MSQDLPRGAFLIRFAEHLPGGFSLTMRDYEVERGAHIKHYKIKCLDQGGYYVTTRQTFNTLPELVAAYMRNSPVLLSRVTLIFHSRLFLKAKRMDCVTRSPYRARNRGRPCGISRRKRKISGKLIAPSCSSSGNWVAAISARCGTVSGSDFVLWFDQ